MQILISNTLAIVFSDTLDTMEGVSQKMHSLVNHEGYRKQKKIVNDFEIIQVQY